MAKKKADLNKMSLEELERYIQQLKEPLVVKPVKKNEGGEAKKGILRRAIDKSANRRKFLKTKEGKAEVKARRAHNKKFSPNLPKEIKGKLIREGKTADAEKGALMLKKGGSLNDAIERVKKVQGMQEGGSTISDDDRQRIGAITGSMMGKKNRQTAEITSELMEAMREIAKSGVRIPRPPRPKNIPRDLPPMSDADREQIINMMGMEDGGEVPKKFKGFSKLPEDVQQQMNPTLAAKYEDGGVVRGMGRAYRGAPRKVKIR